jgi:hypothetical protein
MVPAIIFASVVLPAPLGPTKAIFSPRVISKSTSVKIRLSPYDFETDSSLTGTIPLGGAAGKRIDILSFTSGSSISSIFPVV